MRKIYYSAFTFSLVVSIFCLLNLNTEEPKYLKEFCPPLAIASWWFYFSIYKRFLRWEKTDSSEYSPLWVFNKLVLIICNIFIGIVALALFSKYIGFGIHWYSWLIFLGISGFVYFIFSVRVEIQEGPNDDEGSMAQ